MTKLKVGLTPEVALVLERHTPLSMSWCSHIHYEDAGRWPCDAVHMASALGAALEESERLRSRAASLEEAGDRLRHITEADDLAHAYRAWDAAASAPENARDDPQEESS